MISLGSSRVNGTSNAFESKKNLKEKIIIKNINSKPIISNTKIKFYQNLIFDNKMPLNLFINIKTIILIQYNYL